MLILNADTFFLSETRSMNPGDVDYLPSIFPTHITQRAIHYLTAPECRSVDDSKKDFIVNKIFLWC